MTISVEIKVFAAGLGNNITLKKLPSDKELEFTFINGIEEELFDLVGTVQSNKMGGTTDHIGLIISPLEFNLIPNTAPFIRSVHLGTANYLLPTACTTIQQHTERRCEHEHQLYVFEMEQMIDKQMKAHVFSCFDKDIYVGLEQPRISYTNITTARVFEYLYAKYGEKTEALQNKALADLDKEVDITGPLIISFRLKQNKLKLFLQDTEQAISDRMYIKKYLRVIKNSNYINKALLTWQAQILANQTVTLFWQFITAAHKKQGLKLRQGNNEQASSVMLQKTVKDMALKFSQLEQYTDQ